MMFVQLHVLKRTGASDPPEGVELHGVRIDLIQHVLPVELPGWEEPCAEVILENEQSLVCQGTVQAVLEKLDECLR